MGKLIAHKLLHAPIAAFLLMAVKTMPTLERINVSMLTPKSPKRELVSGGV